MDNNEQRKTVYVCIPSYSIKARIYPNKEQQALISDYYTGLEKAANMALFDLKMHDPAVVETDENGVIWPNFYAMAKASYTNKLRGNNYYVSKLPSVALQSSVGGLFINDLKKMWEAQGKLPVDAWFERRNEKGKLVLRFYKNGKTKSSFFTQIRAGNIYKDEDGRIYAKLPNKIGTIRVRGWNEKIKFGEKGELSFFEQYSNDPNKALSCRISRNNLNEWYLSLSVKNAWRPFLDREEKHRIGIDVNIKEDHGVVSSANGSYPNPRFRKHEMGRTSNYKRILARRYGKENEAFRKDASRIRAANRIRDKNGQELLPPVEMSKRYQKIQYKLSKTDKKVERRRDNYQHIVSSNEIASASFIGIESLNVKGLLKNNNLSEALSDTAMSSQLGKIKYKAQWRGIPIQQIGMFDPSSHICPKCGFRMEGENKFGLETTEWQCPECGAVHQRDQAASEVIRDIAWKYYNDGLHNPDGTLIGSEDEDDSKKKKKPKTKTIPKDKLLDKNHPDIILTYRTDYKAAFKNPWIVVDADGNILDDAQGYGYDTSQKAGKAYRHKLKNRVEA